jgi:high-affinity Fe2+/Pb2+ permease
MANTPPPPALTAAQFHDSRGVDVNVIAWVFTGIAIVIVFLKLFTRSQITKKLGWDDIFIFLSLVNIAGHGYGMNAADDGLDRPSASSLRRL